MKGLIFTVVLGYCILMCVDRCYANSKGRVWYIYATAEVEPNINYDGSNVRGIIQFRQQVVGRKGLATEYVVNITGFDNQDEMRFHATHIHTYGTIREGCEGSEGHYNPTNTTHGLDTSRVRHIGDLGNLQEDDKGNVFMRFRNRRISLKGKYSIVGRTWDTHEFIDDGLPPSGHAGRRMACGIVAKSNGDFWQ